MATPTRNLFFRVSVNVLGNSCIRRGFRFTAYRFLAIEELSQVKLSQPSIQQLQARPLAISATCRTDEEVEVPKAKQVLTDADIENAIAYMHSEEYVEKYRNKPIWNNYRRNHKGQVPKKKMRKCCIRGLKVAGNPCPICRDSNLILHYKNVKLLEQFVNPDSWLLYEPEQTGLCRKTQKTLVSAFEKSKDTGSTFYSPGAAMEKTLSPLVEEVLCSATGTCNSPRIMPITVPHVRYDYDEYYPRDTGGEEKSSSSS